MKEKIIGIYGSLTKYDAVVYRIYVVLSIVCECAVKCQGKRSFFWGEQLSIA